MLPSSTLFLQEENEVTKLFLIVLTDQTCMEALPKAEMQ